MPAPRIFSSVAFSPCRQIHGFPDLSPIVECGMWTASRECPQPLTRKQRMENNWRKLRMWLSPATAWQSLAELSTRFGDQLPVGGSRFVGGDALCPTKELASYSFKLWWEGGPWLATDETLEDLESWNSRSPLAVRLRCDCGATLPQVCFSASLLRSTLLLDGTVLYCTVS